MDRNKMKLPFVSKNPNTLPKSSSWPWPFCYQPRTLSFRKNNDNENATTTTTMFKAAVNSACYLLDAETITESSFLFTNTSSSESAAASFSTASEEYYSNSSGDPIETVIKGLIRSERLFFEPGGETSSILEEANKTTTSPFKESLVLSMESHDPYIDFKRSMEEMVEAHGLKDWEDLEELLCWYLRMNGKSNHGYIITAFVDLLLAALASSSNADFLTCSSFSLASNNLCSPSSSHLSSYTSFSDDSSSTPCCLSSLLVEAAEADDEDDDIRL